MENGSGISLQNISNNLEGYESGVDGVDKDVACRHHGNTLTVAGVKTMPGNPDLGVDGPCACFEKFLIQA